VGGREFNWREELAKRDFGAVMADVEKLTGEGPMTEKQVIKTTCPRDCYDSCGIAVIKRDGRVRKVLGDPDHSVARGALCGKCALAYNGVWRDETARLGQPLRRVGAKCEGRFEPVSWEDALAEIAERLKGLETAGRQEALIHAHYTGTCSLLAGGFPMRFFNTFGAREVDPDSICNKAGHEALTLLYGSSTTGFDPKSVADAACVMVWGANPSASAPHAHKHWLAEARAKIIVIDPIRHPTAAAADLHLQPFPGSDAALAFALLHAICAKGLADEDFLARHCLGWEELTPAIEPCTPAWGEAITGVPAAMIEEVAEIYGRGPSLLWLGQGLQRQPRGGNVMRAAGLLPAVTGNIGKAGAGIYYLNGGWALGLDQDYVEAPPGLPVDAAPPISHMDLPEVLEDPARAEAFFCWNMNVAASAPNQERLRRALAREDLFTVVIDLFKTDTAELADLVLPAASFLEFDDLVTPYFHLLLSAQVKVMEPPGEALPNQEIFRRLAAAMGYDHPALFETDQAILDHVLASGARPIAFEELKAAGTLDLFDSPRIPFADGDFPTPSGKIEIASLEAEAQGLPRLPQPWADPRPSGDRLRLLSPADPWLMNDSYGNDPAIRERLGAARIALNPSDAAERGLAPGDLAEVANATGRLMLEVATDVSLPRGVALSHKGRWPCLDDAGANVNSLNPGAKADMGQSSAVHGIEVAVGLPD
jgi:anaerobic selenocysteine-containing dehydrogenase